MSKAVKTLERLLVGQQDGQFWLHHEDALTWRKGREILWQFLLIVALQKVGDSFRNQVSFNPYIVV